MFVRVLDLNLTPFSARTPRTLRILLKPSPDNDEGGDDDDGDDDDDEYFDDDDD